MNVGERIKKRRKELGISADKMAEMLGKNRATIYRYESSEIENMPLDIIEPLSKVLNVQPSYLMGWENEKETLSSKYSYIPTSISAGIPLDVDGITNNDVEKISIPDSLMGKYAGRNDIYITKINGESMNNVMPDGSLIAVKSINLENLKDGDIVVFSNDYEYSVKRFYQFDDMIVFRPDSTDIRFSETRINVNDVDNLQIHGKVVLYIVELD